MNARSRHDDSDPQQVAGQDAWAAGGTFADAALAGQAFGELHRAGFRDDSIRLKVLSREGRRRVLITVIAKDRLEEAAAILCRYGAYSSVVVRSSTAVSAERSWSSSWLGGSAGR